ncbi:hypothetical protein HMPREF0762_00794 [Slackia exigua ATCC 700122]|uniref:Uncharacterized protein n=1 Tax=Slackia exigua (strain ATCC 700122 / DSM 15923 / CIP 105133 / JCM 11022 / KCTC 5966 / S-7) TaxID=649764 RepID=D0WG43_SLAES|nr:hypothetical protein HMPREF0762_00794 [Slackia exigua ATCC 700122]
MRRRHLDACRVGQPKCRRRQATSIPPRAVHPSSARSWVRSHR